MSDQPNTLQHQSRARRFRGTVVGRLLRHPTFIVGGFGIALVVIASLIGAVVTPYEVNAISVRTLLKAPSAAHWFGTDHLGRDVATRVSHGLFISIIVGTSVVAMSTLAGAALGALAGYYRLLDGPIMRTIDALLAFPALLLALGIAAALGPSMFNVILALSITYTPETARIVRASILVLREQEYIDASRSFGARDRWIIGRHLLPNSLSPLLVQVTAIFAYSVLAEAALSFLGVGLPPPTPSWGAIISDGRSFIVEAWWICLFPGLAITITVLSLNLVGDALRDVLDPRIKSAR